MPGEHGNFAERRASCVRGERLRTCMSSVMRWRRFVVIGGPLSEWNVLQAAIPCWIPSGANHRGSQRSCRISMIENEWFPKAVGLWRVQGGALALLFGSVANDWW